MAASITSNRTFVNRGAQIGVFKHGDNGEMQFVANIRTPAAENTTPSKMLLHSQDQKMMLLSSRKNSSTLSAMDLNTGQVIQEWESSDSNPLMRNIAPVTKYAQATGEESMLGLNNNSIFQMDFRDKNITKNQTYSTRGLHFTSIATTLTGEVVVGDSSGDLRMYSDISKRAKTNLPGLGDLTRGIDVTADGKWLLYVIRLRCI